MKRLIFSLMAAFVIVGLACNTQAAEDPEEKWLQEYGARLSDYRTGETGSAENLQRFLVGTNQYGNAVGMLPPVSSLPSVNLPAVPIDGVRPQRPAAPQAPPVAKRPQAPPAPASPQAPKPPAKTAAKASAPPRNYPRGEAVNDQAKRLYIAGQPIGEIRVRKGRLKGELVNVDQNNLHIHIWPGPNQRIAIPVDRGQYQIAYATGKGWEILPQKTSKIPAGCEPVRIGD